MNTYPLSALSIAQRRALLCFALLMFIVLGVEIVLGCGGTPPQPTCGYSLTLAKASPGPLPLVGGGTATIDCTVFFAAVDTPPGSGACAPPPYSLTVSVTLTCVGGPGGTGSTTLAIVPGFTAVSVAVTVPPGPPRICTVAGIATLTLSDGTVLTATGDTMLCIVEAAPGNPSLPRLGMQHVTPDRLFVHPGDQALNRYLIKNNDPTSSFTGVLSAYTNNVSGIPGVSGPNLPGVGVFALSDPGAGDDPTLRYSDQLPPGCCVPLPPDPQNSIGPTENRVIALLPGQSKVIDILIRKHSMCINGSCSEALALLNGFFSDGTPGMACAGAAVAANSAIPPAYICPGSGSTVDITSDPNPLIPRLTAHGQPSPQNSWAIDTELVSLQLLSNGQHVSSQVLNSSTALSPEYGRIQSSSFFFQPQPQNSEFQIQAVFSIHGSPQGPSLSVQILEMMPVQGAPSGYSDLSPFGMGVAQVTQFNPPAQSFFDVFFQGSVELTDVTGATAPLHLSDFQMSSIGSSFTAILTGTANQPLDQILGVTLRGDFRGYSRTTSETICGTQPICGDGVCNAGENSVSCPQDCATPACPAAISPILNIVVNGTVTQNNSKVEHIAGTMTVHRDTNESCDLGNGNVVISNMNCGTNGNWLIPAQVVLWSLRNGDDAESSSNVFELACGNLRSTFQIGEPGPGFASGTVTLKLLNPTTAVATVNVLTGDSPVFNYTGEWESFELIEGTGPGHATACGFSQFKTDGNDVPLGYTIQYDFLGNLNAMLINPLIMNERIDYDCTTGDFTAQLCHIDDPVDLCPADIAPNNGDGVVNASDLLLVINSWGPCGSCPADIAPQPNGNGVVNSADLLAVINSWGPCVFGSTFNVSYDSGLSRIDYELVNGPQGRIYWVDGTACGKVKFTEGMHDLTGPSDSNHSDITCKGAGTGSVTVTIRQKETKVTVSETKICFTCSEAGATPTEVDCP